MVEFTEIAVGDEDGVKKINDNFNATKQQFEGLDNKNEMQRIVWSKDSSYPGKVTYFEAYRRGNVVSIDAKLEVLKKGEWMNAIRGLPKAPRDTATGIMFCDDGGTLATFSVQAGGVLSLYGNSGNMSKFPNTLTIHTTYLASD